MGDSLQTLDHIRASAIDMGLRFGLKLFVALLIAFAGYLAARWVGGLVERLLVRLHLEAPIRALLTRVVQILVFGLFAIMAMQNLGVELLPLVAGLGVAGAGIALALQGVLGNVAAGLTIIFTRPFHVGDYISIAKEEGEVLDINLFSTTLGHTDRSKVIIPNRKIVGEILHNCGQIRRLSLSVGVAYGSDLPAVLARINALLSANPRVLETPAPVVGVGQLGDSAISITIAPWVKVPDYEAATSEIHQAVLAAFRADGIEIPYPQRVVHLAGSPTPLSASQ